MTGEKVTPEALNEAYLAWRQAPSDARRADELNAVLTDAVQAGQGLELVSNPRVLRRRKFKLNGYLKRDIEEATGFYGKMTEEDCVFEVRPWRPETGRRLISLWGLEVFPDEGGVVVLRGASQWRAGEIHVKDIKDLRLMSYPNCS